MKSFKTPQAALANFGKMGTGAAIPVLCHFLVDGGWLACTDLTSAFRMRHGWPVQPERYLIEAAQVLAFAKNETITEFMLSEGKVKTNLGRTVSVVTGDEAADYPKSILTTPNFVDPVLGAEIITKQVGHLTLEDAELANYLAANFASKDALRQAMTQVVINKNSLVATDAHVLTVRKLTGKIDAQYLPLRSIPKVSKPVIAGNVEVVIQLSTQLTTVEQKKAGVTPAEAFKKDLDVNKAILYGGLCGSAYTIITDEDGDLQVAYRHTGERYPDYSAVIPTKENDTIQCEVNPNELAEQIKLLLPSANKTTSTIVVDFNRSKLVSSDIDFNTEMEIDMLPGMAKPMIKTESFVTAFNGKFMLKILGSYKSYKSLLICLQSESRAIRVNGSLIMPMMVNQDYYSS